MKQTLLIIILFVNSFLTLFGQDTILFPYRDTTYMYYDRGAKLKPNLKDGHYIAYRTFPKKDTTEFIFEVTIINGLKEGVELCYTYKTQKIFWEINWKNGMKNGIERKFNENGSLEYLLTFKNDTLDGLCIKNWLSGAKYYKGYFKNGLKDGTWYYYENEDGKNNDSTNYWLNEEYEYHNGNAVLVNIWNSEGEKVIKNGSGLLKTETFNGINFTPYIDGLIHGYEIEYDKTNNDTLLKKYYQQGYLLSETKYLNNKLISYKEWGYNEPRKTDTVLNPLDQWLFDIKYLKLDFSVNPIPNGNRIEYYDNFQVKYSGKYEMGKRIGYWVWYYQNGTERIKVDYNKNKWEHYDSTGKKTSTFKGEFLTKLTEHEWFLNESIDSNFVTLSTINELTVTPMLVFFDDNTLKIIQWLECGKNIGEVDCKYILNGNILTLIIKDIDKSKNYKFEIIEDNNNKIKLKKINSSP